MSVQPKLLNLSIYINEHLRDELTLEVLAARMNLSPFHFHRKFRAYFGESLHQHIKRLRLESSAHALLYQLIPVSAVAKSSGYKTLSAFSHAFSAHFGVAPTRFREVMLMGRLSGLEATLRERLGADWIEALAPARIENVPGRSCAFLRSEVKGNGELAAACATLENLQGLVGTQSETVVASVDLFGLLTEGPFRIEIGRDVADVEPAVVGQLGSLNLAAGRYAQFDYVGEAQRLADVVRAIYLFWLPHCGERVRQVAHYVTSSDALAGAGAHWRIHIPLDDGALAATPAHS
ncbi:MAG: AraC family transcriptional regulator [Burkholderiaceae bacterium]|jgi:AraC family transcriptional regulator